MMTSRVDAFTRTHAAVAARAVTCLLALLGGLVAAGCDDDPPRRRAEPERWAWREVTLPAPANAGEHLVIRDVTVCDGTWYVVGAMATSSGDTRPAAWRSADGASWQTITMTPLTFWGKQHVMYSAACRGALLAAMGAKRGGAHANPRTSSWHTDAGGGMTEMIDAYTLFGGPDALNVSKLVAGPDGWMIAGNRLTGAAAWTSPDGSNFTLRSNLPQLKSDPEWNTYALDTVADGRGWTLVGGASRPGRIDRDPAAWSTTDGASWQRAIVPGSAAYEEFQRAVRTDAGLVAAGLRGDVFGAWQRRDDGWHEAGQFGTVQAKQTSGPIRVGAVGSLAAGPAANVAAAVSDGVAFTLWRSPDGGGTWVQVVLPPASFPAGPDQAMAIAWAGGRWMLAADDGKAGRVWVADFSG